MSRSTSLFFWVTWVALTSFSGGLALVLAALLVQTILPPSYFATSTGLTGDNLVPHLLIWGCGLLMFLGPLIGAGQSLALWALPTGVSWHRWLGMTSLGGCCALLVLLLVSVTVHPTVGALVPGIILGIAQAGVLHNSKRQYSIWIATNGLAWLFAIAVGNLLASSILPKEWQGLPFYPAEAVLHYALSGVIFLGLFSAITGVTLVWLFQNSS